MGENELFEKIEKNHVIVRQSYFKEMSDAFEYLINALSSNSSGNVPKAIKALNYIRSGLDLQKAKESSERCKKFLLLTDDEIRKLAEPTTNNVGKD